MLLDTLKTIEKMQNDIGNRAEVRMSVVENNLVIRVDWWEVDFHARRVFRAIEIEKVKDENFIINGFVLWCRDEYLREMERRKKESNEN